MSLLFSGGGIYFAKDILGLMKASPEVIEEGCQYPQILIGGNITIVLLFLINTVFGGAGNTSYAIWVFQIPLAYLTALYFE